MDSMSFNGQWPGVQSRQCLVRAFLSLKNRLDFIRAVFPVVRLLEFFQEA